MAVRFSADAQDYTGATSVGTAFTVTCWARIRTDRNNYSTIWGLDQNTGSTGAIALQAGADGTQIDFGISGGTNFLGPNMVVDTWYAFIFTRTTATAANLYAGTDPNALTTYAGNLTGSPTSYTTLRIGESGWAAEWLNGAVANLKVYNAALTLAEATAELYTYRPQRTTNLLRWHPLVNAELLDYSGNGSTLTATGAGAVAEDGPPISWSVIPALQPYTSRRRAANQ